MERLAILGTALAVWSFTIWGSVLFAKSIVLALRVPKLTAFWERTKALAAPFLGMATGPLTFPFTLAVAGLVEPLPDSLFIYIPAIGAFLGIGAGSVASKAHDVALGRLEDLLRGK